MISLSSSFDYTTKISRRLFNRLPISLNVWTNFKASSSQAESAGQVLTSKEANVDLSQCASLAAGATRVSLGSLAILLLTGVSSRTTLRRTLLLAILLALRWVPRLSVALLRLLTVALLRWLSVLASLGRLSVLLALRRTILALWRSAVLTALRWATVTLLRSTVAAAWRPTVTAGSWVGLLVLGVVRAIDGTEEELDGP